MNLVVHRVGAAPWLPGSAPRAAGGPTTPGAIGLRP